jgi:hypothetical protein
MSILYSFKKQPVIKVTAEEFYQDFDVVKIQWWLADCSYYPDLYWARLRIFSNGKADVLFENEEVMYGFENEEFAGYFIAEDEFSKFENIDEDDRNDLEIPKDAVIESPNWENKEVNNFEYIGTD